MQLTKNVTAMIRLPINCLLPLLLLCSTWLLIPAARAAEDNAEWVSIEPLVRVIDLDIGESSTVELCDGTQIPIRLLSLLEIRDPIRAAVRRAELVLEIDGKSIALSAGPLQLPIEVAGVQIDCTATRGLNGNGTPEFWGLDKDARLRLWPAGSPLIRPGTLIYPVRQDWFATRTWFDNQVVDGGDRIKRQIYYHAGVDIGGSEGLTEVIAATDSLVIQRGLEVLAGYREDTPARPRSDVVYLEDRIVRMDLA